MVLLPLVLVIRVIRLKGIRKEDLHKPGTELAGGGGDTMTGAAVASRENFGRDLGVLGFYKLMMRKEKAYNECSDVWTKVKGDVAQYIEHNESRATRVQQPCPCAACYDEEYKQYQKSPKLNDFWRHVLHNLNH
jgi:hypothetical protein